MKKLGIGMVVALSLLISISAWAGTIESTGDNVNGQGLLTFDPATMGNTLTIGSDGTNQGALITNLLETLGICGGGNCR